MLRNVNHVAMRAIRRLRRGEVEGRTMSAHAIGYIEEEFCGRPVILFKRVPGMFGCPCVRKPTLVKHTLVNGMVNQMEITEKPSPYWAVLDAASALRGPRGTGCFTDEAVVAAAVETLRTRAGRDASDETRRACKAAWNTLKWHQNHPWKKTRGLGFIVDVWGTEGTTIRARHEDETMSYFESSARRRKAEPRHRDRKARMPTDKEPIAMVYR